VASGVAPILPGSAVPHAVHGRASAELPRASFPPCVKRPENSYTVLSRAIAFGPPQNASAAVVFDRHGNAGADWLFAGDHEFLIDPEPDGTVLFTHVETFAACSSLCFLR
jgi:hypothetical protein